MKQFLGAAALAAVVAVAVPAIATAHPTVYPTSAKTYTGTYPNGTLNTVTRYVVINHGFVAVMTESNGREGATGVVGFNLVPGGTYRAAKNSEQIIQEGATGAQAHATCIGGTSDLGSIAKVTSWQGGNQPAPTTQQPFWAYVPFQTTSVGLDDNPTDWTPTLLAAGFTTADFATPASAKAACEAKGATYYAADTVTTTNAALTTGVTAPLETQITGLKAEKTTLTEENQALKDQGSTTVSANTTLNSQIAGLNATLAGAQAELATAKTAVSSLLLAATTIKLAVGSTKAKSVASSGQTVGIIAAPLKAVTVTVSISEAQARKLKLVSSVLGEQTATTAADGTASVTVKVSKAAAKALKALKGSLSTTVEATSGDRFATATAKLTR